MHVNIKPRTSIRFPLLSVAASQHHHHYHHRARRFATSTRITAANDSTYRTFWTWRGGDDKKWNWRGGEGGAAGASNDITPAEEDDVQDEATRKEAAAANANAAKETSTNSKQPLLSPSAYPVSVCTAQGFRSYMEDEFFLSMDGDFAAVYDGHGGPAVSRYLRKNLYANVQAFLPVSANGNHHHHQATDTTTTTTTTTTEPLNKRKSPTVQDYETAMESALDKVDREVQRISHWSYQGSTAVAIWLHEERTTSTAQAEDDTDTAADQDEQQERILTNTQRTIIAANVGDSRAVLCRNATAWELTRDHKPNDPYEKARIEKLGGQVVWCGDTTKGGEPIRERGIYRVNGNLALSRAIGDRSERPHVTAEPEIVSATILDGQDEFIILATDGLWDVMDSHDAVDCVLSLQEEGHDRDKIATLMVEEALRRGTYDNITVVIIWLDRNNNNNNSKSL